MIQPCQCQRWLPTLVLALVSGTLSGAGVFEQVDGPYDGHVTSYVRDSGSGLIFATGMGLGLGGGVFVSADNGDTWNSVAGNSQLGDSTVNTPQQFGIFQENIGLPSVSGLHASNFKLGIDPNTTPNTLYTGFFYSAAPSRVMRSLDSGVTWQNFSTGLVGVTPYEFALAPDGDMFLAGFGGSGLHVLPAGGASWVTMTTGTNNARAVAVDQVNGDIYFTNMQNTLDASKPAVFRSSNDGASFTGVTLATSVVGGGAADAGSYNRLLNSIGIDNTVSPPVIHVGFKDRWQWLTSTQIALGGHFRSTDYGATWASGTARNVESMTVDSAGRVYLGVGDNSTYYGEVWRSTDKGLSFSKLAHPGVNDIATVVSLQAFGASTLFAGADGPYRSLDSGVTWTRLNNRGMKANRRVTEVGIDSDGTIYCASNQHGISRSNDGGATWTPANGAGASRIGSLYVNTVTVDPITHHVFAGTGLGQSAARFYRSIDQGASWTQVVGFTANYKTMDCVIAQNGNIVFSGVFGGPGGGHYSTDGGLTSLNSTNPVSGQPIYSMAVNPVSGHIYAGTETEATWLSTDHGVTFSPLTWATATLNGCSGQLGNKGNIFGIAVSLDGGTVYEAALRGLFKSTNNGASWQQVNVPGAGGCGQVGLGVFIDPNGYIYYLFTESTPAGPKLKRSIDGGTVWTDYNTGLPVDSRGGYGTHAMAFNPVDGKLYMGVSWPTVNIKQGTSGLWRSTAPVYLPTATASPTPSPSPSPTPSFTPAPATSTFYFHNQSAIGIYRLMNEVIPSGTGVSATASYCPDREIVDFASEKVGPLSIPAGNWNFKFHAYTAPGTGAFQVQVGTIDTFGNYNWVFTTNSPATSTAPPASLLSWSVARPLLNLPAGYRLAVVIYGQGSSCPAPYYEQLAYDGASVPSSLEIPLPPTGFTPTFTPTPTTVSGTTYYLHNAPGIGLFKLMNSTAPSGADSTTITVACPGPELIDFASPVLGPLTIPPGFWNFNFYSSVAPGLAQYQVQVWSVDAGGNPSTFYFTAASSPGVLYGPPGSPVTWSHFRGSNVVLPAGHRLGLLIYVVNGITCPDNFNLRMDYDGLSSPSSLNFPLQPPTPTPTVTVSFSDSPTPMATDTITPSPSSSVTPSVTETRTVTPSITETRTVTASITPSITVTGTVTPSVTPSTTETSTATPSITPTITPTITATPSVTPSITETYSASSSPSSSVTSTWSSTATPSPSASPSPSPSPTPTWSPEPWIWPLSASSVPDTMNTSFGPRMNYSQWDMHDGIDLPALTGTAMVAVASGFVHLTGEAGANGASSRHVVLRLPDALGNTIYVSYFHLSTVAATLTIGAPVAQGAAVGTVGSDDASYSHLHFEIRKNSPFQIASIHPLHYLPYTDTLNFEPASPPVFSYLTGGLAGRISFTAANKEEGDLARVELDFRQGGALLNTRVVNFDDKATINEGNSDTLQWVNDIAVEGYQWSNMGLQSRTDLHYGVLFRALPALADNVTLRVIDIGGNTRTSGPFAILAPAPSCENLTFEDGQVPPAGWNGLTSATGSGTTVTAQAASAMASAYGMQCLDASTSEAFDQRAAITRAIDPAKIEWRLDAWMRAASLNLPLNGDYTRVLTLENTSAGYPVAGAGYRRSGGVDYYAGYYRNVTWTGTFDTTTVTAALGAWQQWSLAFKRLGTRESTVIFLLDGSELSRSQWDSTLFPFDALRVGLASTRVDAQVDLSVDDVQVREADDLGCLATPTPTPTSTSTVSQTSTGSPSATRTASPSDTPTATPSATPSASPSSTETPSATPSSSGTPTQTISETNTPGPTATYTVTPTPSATPSATTTITLTDSPSDSPTGSPSETPSVSATPTFSATGTATLTATSTLTATPTSTQTLSATPVDTATVTPPFTATITPTDSDTSTPSPTDSPSDTPVDTTTVTPSDSPTDTATETPSNSPSSSVTPSDSPSVSPSNSPSPTFSSTITPSSTSTPSITPSSTVTPSHTPSVTPSPSSTLTVTPSISASGTASVTETQTTTASPSPSRSVSPSQTPSPSPSATPSTASITNVGNSWTPVLLTVPVGATVTWIWTGFHNVVSTTGAEPYSSGAATSGGSFSHAFNTPGTFTYECAVHGASMSGTITVLALATATATPAGSATVTPSMSQTFTESPVFSPTPTFSASPTFTESPVVTATPTAAGVTLDGLLRPTLGAIRLTEITRVFSVPSPLSRARVLLMVEMTGNADDFEVQVFSPGFTLISKTLIPGPAGPGLNYLPFDASALPGGVLFVRVIARSNSQRSQRTARVYLLP